MDLWNRAKALGKELGKDLVKGVQRIGKDVNEFLEEIDSQEAADSTTPRSGRERAPTIFDSSLTECISHAGKSAMKSVEGVFDSASSSAAGGGAGGGIGSSSEPFTNWKVHENWTSSPQEEKASLISPTTQPLKPEAVGHSNFEEQADEEDEEQVEVEVEEERAIEETEGGEEEGDEEGDEEGVGERLTLVGLSSTTSARSTTPQPQVDPDLVSVSEEPPEEPSPDEGEGDEEGEWEEEEEDDDVDDSL